MSEAFHIISDGSCDLPMELTKEKDITVVPFYVSFEEGKYQKEMIEIGVREFYQEMVDHPDVYPKSSMPSVQDYVDAFLPFVKAGTPIICICITTKFSGSMQSALNAKAILEEEYPNAQIYVCDSTVNTVLQGIYVLEAVRLRDAGKSYQESIDRLNEIKSSGRIFFTVGNMEYLKHGGRIGKVASVAGSLLGIKPIITLKEGEIFPSGIGRSRRKTVDKNIDLLLAYFAEEKADIVIGERPIDDTEHFSPLKKKLQHFGSWTVRVASKSDIPDAPSGFRAYSRDAAMRLNVTNEYTYTLETIIQAGRTRMAMESVPIRTNPELRKSRLFSSMFGYVKRSMVTIVRSFMMYKPLRFFLGIGSVLFLCGALLGVRFLFYYAAGSGNGHVQSLILASILMLMGFQTGVIGLLADIIAANRKILEDVQYHARKLDYDREKEEK